MTTPVPPPSPTIATRRPRGPVRAEAARATGRRAPSASRPAGSRRRGTPPRRLPRRSRARPCAMRPPGRRPRCLPAASRTTCLPARRALRRRRGRTPGRRGSPRSRRRSRASRSSAANASTSSAASMSAWFPSEAKREKPRPYSRREQAELRGEVAALRDDPERAGRELAHAEIELGRRRRRRRGSSARAARLPQPRTRSTIAALELLAGLVDLSEPGRDRDDRPRAGGERGVDRLPRTRPPATATTTSSGAPGRSVERAVRLPAEDLAAVAIDEPDLTPVRALQRPGRDPLTPLGRVARRRRGRRPSAGRRAAADRARGETMRTASEGVPVERSSLRRHEACLPAADSFTNGQTAARGEGSQGTAGSRLQDPRAAGQQARPAKPRRQAEACHRPRAATANRGFPWRQAEARHHPRAASANRRFPASGSARSAAASRRLSLLRYGFQSQQARQKPVTIRGQPVRTAGSRLAPQPARAAAQGTAGSRLQDPRAARQRAGA